MWWRLFKKEIEKIMLRSKGLRVTIKLSENVWKFEQDATLLYMKRHAGCTREGRRVEDMVEEGVVWDRVTEIRSGATLWCNPSLLLEGWVAGRSMAALRMCMYTLLHQPRYHVIHSTRTARLVAGVEA